ncbi:ADP-ribosyl cyclase/cyclic ADP-ribose hydrolase-like [Oscarella lobularis]|uniref:ADP-ribosyl cyclase/cyclic ADP-ribose hydrolase-like n=1 Tax=Oscarella lobularis TaxID=121494 RepID=UPI003313D938
MHITAADASRLIVLLVCCAAAIAAKGTTPHIRDIFIGRCEYFKRFGLDASSFASFLDCNSTWNAFFRAFAFKQHCDVELDAFDSFYTITKQKVPTGKSTFWSGTQALSQLFASDGLRAYTIRQTFMGFLVDELTWCGSSTDSSGLNFTYCPSFNENDCSNQAMASFWGGASKQFALQSTGSVYLLLNGSRGSRPAFVNTSFFGLYELPNLSLDQNEKVQILIANTLGMTPNENCDTGSLVTLKERLTSRGLQYSCEDNPPILKYMLCALAENPTSFRECQFASDRGSLVTHVNLLFLLFVCFIIVVLH